MECATKIPQMRCSQQDLRCYENLMLPLRWQEVELGCNVSDGGPAVNTDEASLAHPLLSRFLTTDRNPLGTPDLDCVHTLLTPVSFRKDPTSGNWWAYTLLISISLETTPTRTTEFGLLAECSNLTSCSRLFSSFLRLVFSGMAHIHNRYLQFGVRISRVMTVSTWDLHTKHGTCFHL